jgi:hypothetical protein
VIVTDTTAIQRFDRLKPFGRQDLPHSDVRGHPFHMQTGLGSQAPLSP